VTVSRVKSNSAGKAVAKREKDRRNRKRKSYSEDERTHALKLIVSGMARTVVAEAVGCSTESLRLWFNKAKADGKLPSVPIRGRSDRG
jgi:transposase-like protein